MRKLFIEQQVREAIQNGVKQVVVLGGGYDTLALRLHLDYKKIYFYEIDRGHTRDTKLSAVKELEILANKRDKTSQFSSVGKTMSLANVYGNIGNNLYFLESDLSKENWYEELYACEKFNKEKSTIVIAEGLTMYLTTKQVRALLQTLNNQVLSEGSLIITSFAQSIKSTQISTLLRAETNESYECFLNMTEVPTFVHENQFSVLGKVLTIDFQKQAENTAALAAVKNSPDCLAPENYYILQCTKNNSNAVKSIKNIPDIKIKVPEKKEHARSVCPSNIL